MKNKKIKLIIIFAIPALIVAGICVWGIKEKINKDTSSLPGEVKILPETIIPVNYNWSIFYAAIGQYPNKDSAADDGASGAIVPHHDLAADYTAELFQEISRRDVRTVIIVGPNHENTGAGDIITGLVAYSLQPGRVPADNKLIEQIIKDKIAISDVNRLRTEHSIYNVAPYVSYYFPDAKIVPIILSGRVTEAQAENLGEYLASYLNDQTIIIGSIDFSHYLTTENARANDTVTRDALVTRDYKKIYSFNNDYIDSPATAVTVLVATKKVGAQQVDIVRNANQADAIGMSSVPSSTSYFTVLFRR
jgi:AmmeMemoRadiSam system protein B